MRRLISSGSSFEKIAGYSRAVQDGEWIFVSGCTGFNYTNMEIEEDVVLQVRQAFSNIDEALKRTGAGLEDVVRVKYYFTHKEDWERIAPVLGEFLGRIRPAATAIICGLIDSRMKIEIEVTARKRAS